MLLADGSEVLSNVKRWARNSNEAQTARYQQTFWTDFPCKVKVQSLESFAKSVVAGFLNPRKNSTTNQLSRQAESLNLTVWNHKLTLATIEQIFRLLLKISDCLGQAVLTLALSLAAFTCGSNYHSKIKSWRVKMIKNRTNIWKGSMCLADSRQSSAVFQLVDPL